MHEMAILTNVVDAVVVHAQKNNASEVKCVTLVVGELRDVVDELMESCFRFLAKGTVAENARLVMEKVPLKVQCSECRLVFPASLQDQKSLICPDCGCDKLSVAAGREFYISSIEIVEKENGQEG